MEMAIAAEARPFYFLLLKTNSATTLRGRLYPERADEPWVDQGKRTNEKQSYFS